MYNIYLKPNICKTKLLILYAIQKRKKKKTVSGPVFPAPIDNTVMTVDEGKDRWIDR